MDGIYRGFGPPPAQSVPHLNCKLAHRSEETRSSLTLLTGRFTFYLPFAAKEGKKSKSKSKYPGLIDLRPQQTKTRFEAGDNSVPFIFLFARATSGS